MNTQSAHLGGHFHNGISLTLHNNEIMTAYGLKKYQMAIATLFIYVSLLIHIVVVVVDSFYFVILLAIVATTLMVGTNGCK